MKRPLIIGIGGPHSDVGKTSLAAALLRYLTKDRGRKSPTEGELWGAIKYTKTAFYSAVTDDSSILGQEDKDTRLMLDAGAVEVLWVQSPAEGLEEVLPMAVDRLSHLDGIIIEGNSAIEFLKPCIVIFLKGNSGGDKIKPSASAVLKRADIIMERSVRFDEKTIKNLVERVDDILREKEMAERLEKGSVDGAVPCGLARKIAEELGVPYSEVGRVADALKIKIKNCELGCF